MQRILFSCLFFVVLTVAPASERWPQFRGPDGDGHAEAQDLPLTWSETNNVAWKTVIPGEGWSSPVIDDRYIWMETAQDDGHSLRGICVDRASGKILHNIEIFHVDAPEPKHAVNSHASPTPVLESGRAYFSFGMYGMACLDSRSGKILWRNMELKHDHDKNGPGSSPILYQNLFIVNCDGTEQRYVAALNKETGKLAWKTERSNLINRSGEFKKAYSTSQIIRVHGEDQLISMGAFRLSAYAPLSGKEIWWADIPGFSNVPRPLFAKDLVYISTGFGKPEMWAIRADGRGDMTKSGVVWKVQKQAPAKPSPLLAGSRLYMISDGGIATALNAATGEQIWQERVGGEYSASPILAADRIYLFSHEGVTTVLAPRDKFEVLATNHLDQGFMASPAVVGHAIFARTKSHLYRLEDSKPKK